MVFSQDYSMYGSPAQSPRIVAGPSPLIATLTLVVLSLSVFVIAGTVVISIARVVRFAFRVSGLSGAIDRLIAPVRAWLRRGPLLQLKLLYDCELRPLARRIFRGPRERYH